MSQQETKYHTEVIDLPSKGWFYPKDHPLASGQIELFYMTAAHEDILTSRNLIQKGVVIDKLLEALIADKNVKMDEILISDKSAIMIASRILGYGKEYPVKISCPNCDTVNEMVIDLEGIDNKESELFTDNHKGTNVFPFQLPVSKKTLQVKLLTHADERNIRLELEGLKRVVKSDVSKEATTRLKHCIVSVDGEADRGKVNNFVDTMPARDSLALREYLRKVAPDVDLTTEFSCSNCGHEGRVEIPIDINFFWPNVQV